MPIACPRQILCSRVESQVAQLCPEVECPRVECPRVSDFPKGSDLSAAGHYRGTRHLVASYAIGALIGGCQYLADRAGNGLSKLITPL